MQHTYSQPERDALVASAQPRVGWDFARMNVQREAVPWEYADIVARYVRPSEKSWTSGLVAASGSAAWPGCSVVAWASISIRR